MQYSQEHLKTMVYAKFGGQTECIMGNWKIENSLKNSTEGKFVASSKQRRYPSSGTPNGLNELPEMRFSP